MTYPMQNHGTVITGEILSSKQFPLLRLRRPLFISRVEAGFPSQADDYIEGDLDLYELLIPHPASTYFVRVKGHSMKGVGIFNGDILVVDRFLMAGRISMETRSFMTPRRLRRVFLP